jgi:hypothetical protein
MRKVALLWVVALFVLFTLFGSLMLSSPAIMLVTEIYHEIFGQTVDPAAQN